MIVYYPNPCLSRDSRWPSTELAVFCVTCVVGADNVHSCFRGMSAPNTNTCTHARSFAIPLSDGPWLEQEITRIQALGSEPARLGGIQAMINWSTPVKGGWFDLLGSGSLARAEGGSHASSRAPHLLQGEGTAADPEFYYTPHVAAFSGIGYVPAPTPRVFFCGRHSRCHFMRTCLVAFSWLVVRMVLPVPMVRRMCVCVCGGGGRTRSWAYVWAGVPHLPVCF